MDGVGKVKAMERLPKFNVDAYVASMHQEFERLMREVARAVNDAPTGQVINASEHQVRDAMGEFRTRAYERALQMRVDAAEAAFSPGGSDDGQTVARQGKLRAHAFERQRSCSHPPASLPRG